jgi:hypothetical protein
VIASNILLKELFKGLMAGSKKNSQWVEKKFL